MTHRFWHGYPSVADYIEAEQPQLAGLITPAEFPDDPQPVEVWARRAGVPPSLLETR